MRRLRCGRRAAEAALTLARKIARFSRSFAWAIVALSCVAPSTGAAWTLSYPYYPWLASAMSADGSHGVSAYSQLSCVDAYTQLIGDRCASNVNNIAIRESVVGPFCYTCQWDVLSECRYSSDGLLHPTDESCIGGGCPYGGTQSGSSCVSLPACPSPQKRNLVSGKCEQVDPDKSLGKPDCPLCQGNPINAGTGTKFQSEVIYRGAGLLTEELYYNSRLAVMAQ